MTDNERLAVEWADAVAVVYASPELANAAAVCRLIECGDKLNLTLRELPSRIIAAWNTLHADVPPGIFDYRQDLARARVSVSNIANRLAHTMRERDEALARLLEIGACLDGYPHYCPNCDRTFTAATSEAQP